MGFSRTSENGTYETPSETIGAMLTREWDLTNSEISTGGTTPKVKFIYDQNLRNPENLTDMLEAVVLSDGGTINIPERTAQGHGLVGMGDLIVMTVFASSQRQRKLYEFEIYRILRKMRPIGNNPPIKKSNNIDISSIHDYDEILPEFVAFDDGVKGREMSSKSSAILTVLSEWVYS